MSQFYDCEIESSDYAAFFTSQNPQITHMIQRDLAVNAPYLNTIEGETINLNNRGESIVHTIPNRGMPAWSRAVPNFVRTTETCGTTPERDQLGQTAYETKMEALKGRGPLVCVHDAKHSVLNQFRSAADELGYQIKELMEYDIRAQYLFRSGSKFVARSGTSFNSLFTGARRAVGTPFAPVLPDSTMTFQALIKLGNYMSEVMGVEHFGNGVGRHFKVIAGVEQIENFRNEAQVLGALIAQTQGSYGDGNDAIKAYTWADVQSVHRGYMLGVDQYPLRFNEYSDGEATDVNGNVIPAGFPIFIEPEIAVATDDGVASDPNPAWLNAEYEVGFVLGRYGFKRLVPARYVGESSWKWAPQFVMGELQWHNLVDNGCNEWGEFGYHKYRVERAIQAWKPHAVCPFVYKRCEGDLGLVPCESISS